jgi:hypothetical protein
VIQIQPGDDITMVSDHPWHRIYQNPKKKPYNGLMPTYGTVYTCAKIRPHKVTGKIVLKLAELPGVWFRADRWRKVPKNTYDFREEIKRKIPVPA